MDFGSELVKTLVKGFKKCPWGFYLISTAVFLALYFRFINALSVDFINYIDPWFRNIQYNGGFWVLKDNFYNYAPTYMYILVLATLLPYKAVICVKLVTLPWVLLGGFLMKTLARVLNRDAFWGWLGYSLVILAPTIFINAAYWAQADVFYGVAVVATVYLMLHARPLPAMLAFGLAISFKSQAVFLGPFLLLMLIRRDLPWKYIVIPPLVFLISLLPVVLIGRPLWDVFSVYLVQTDMFRDLCINCATLWALLPWVNYDTGMLIGMGLTLAAAAVYIIVSYKTIGKTDLRKLYVAAVLSLLIMPFFLPKMHERYFYAAEMLSVGLIFVDWRLGIVPFMLQISAFNLYLKFLRQPYSLPVEFSGVVNLIVLILLVCYFLKMKPEAAPDCNRVLV